jgi:hypothetical protein
MNARQLLRHLRGTYPIGKWKMPDPCILIPPDLINAYQDGSMKQPSCQQWSLGAIGVWWPQRSLDCHPLTWAESAYMELGKENTNPHASGTDGVTLLGALTGQRCSSTRAELGAGILAIHGPTAVHQGTDSQAYLMRANKILAGVNLTTRKPWGIQKDGDLWQIFEQSATAKGLEAIRITKVKAHSTSEMIATGVTTSRDKHGNDTADRAADAGILLHGADVAELATFFQARHKEYEKIMGRIYTLILAVRKEVDELLAKSKNGDFGHLFGPMQKRERRQGFAPPDAGRGENARHVQATRRPDSSR